MSKKWGTNELKQSLQVSNVKKTGGLPNGFRKREGLYE